MIANSINRFRIIILNSSTKCNFSSKIDFSKVPKLLESELEEEFVRGSGPGGQSVNKTANKVVLKHLKTGIVVNCHLTRSLEKNRQEARKLMTARLDEFYNKENSVQSQIKRQESLKQSKSKSKREKLENLKQQWKESNENSIKID